MSAALVGRALGIHGDGGQTRDFTYVGSVTRAITDAVMRGVTSPRPVNLAFGSRASLLELIAIIEQVLGHLVGRSHVAVRAGDVRHSQADQAAFSALFPELQAVPLMDGVRRTVAWFQTG